MRIAKSEYTGKNESYIISMTPYDDFMVGVEISKLEGEYLCH